MFQVCVWLAKWKSLKRKKQKKSKIRQLCFGECAGNTLVDRCTCFNLVDSYKTDDKHQQPAKRIMLDRRKRPGVLPHMWKCIHFYTRRPKCDKRVPHKSTTVCGDERRHSSSAASVHVKVLVCLCVKMLIFSWACASVLRVDTYPLSKAEVRKYREKRKTERKKEHGRSRKRQISELAQDRK